MQTTSPSVQKVLGFLTEIGLPWEISEGASGFLSNCEIRAGKLYVDPGCTSSSLLHEAAHLAILPGDFRHLCSGDLGQLQKAMFVGVSRLDPDDPLLRCMLQCSDPEATAWAWAAGTHLGLAETDIIADDEYDHGGEHMRQCLSMRAYLGINGLQAMGMTAVRVSAYRPHVPAYPKLTYWLAPTYDATPEEIEGVTRALNQAKATTPEVASVA